MRLGLQIPSFRWPGGPAEIGPRLSEIAGAAEAAGLDSLWLMDHFFQIEMVGPVEDPMLECYTALGFLAGATRRVRLGAMVTGVIYREPGLLAKAATTLDVLSGGRAYLGIGAGWFEREARGLGFPFPPIKERFERLEEALRITRRMWAGETGPFEGRHYRLAETLGRPLPLARPHPPILIGGMGERKTLRLVAKYGDACNIFLFAGVDEIRKKLDVLKRHCEAEKRDYATIEKTVLGTIDLSKETPKEILGNLRALAAIGIEHAIFNMPDVHEIRPLEVLGREVVPAAAGL